MFMSTVVLKKCKMLVMFIGIILTFIPVPFYRPVVLYSQSYPLQQNIMMEELVLNRKVHELTILT